MRSLLYAFVLAPTVLFAQQPDWLVSWPVGYALNPGMPRHVMAASHNGEYMMSGRLMTGVFNYGQDVFGPCTVERIDPSNGQVMWSCMYGDSVTVDAGAVDEEGNVYIAGQLISSAQLCNAEVLGHTQGGGQWDLDLYVIKFDASGYIQWNRNISVTEPDATSIPSLAIDPNGELWYTTCDFFSARATHVNADGDVLETRVIDGAKTIGSVAFSPSGAMYVSGSASNGGFAFGGIALQPTETYSMFVLRYKADGTGDWVEFAPDATFQQPNLDVDQFGSVYIAGHLMSPTNWGGISFNGPDWVSAVFITKADSTGQFLWGAESDPAGGTIDGDLSGAARNTVAADEAGHVYITGTLRGEVDWGNGVVSDAGSMQESTQTIVAFSVDGTPQWAATSSPSGIFNSAMAIAASDDGQVYFSSHVTGEYDFTPLATNVGGDQAYVIGHINNSVMGVVSMESVDGSTVWPVPASTSVSIHLDPPTKQVGRLIASNGQCVRTITLQPGVNSLDIASLASGPYTLVVGEQRLRLVKE